MARPTIIAQKINGKHNWHRHNVFTNCKLGNPRRVRLIGSAQTFISAREWPKHCVGNKARLAISRAKKARAALRRYKAETKGD